MNGSSPLAERLGPLGDASVPLAPLPRARPQGSVSVYDLATGEERFEDPATATELFKAGKVNLVKGTKVGVEGPDGEIHETNTDDVSGALEAGGTLTGADTAHHAEVLREQSGFSGMALSGALGAADAATLGNASNAVGLFGQDADEAAQAAIEQHGTANALGQVAGSFLMPGGGAAMGLGRLAEGAVASEGAGLGLRALAKGAQGAASGAAFGGLQGLADTLSEHALHDGFESNAPLTGEQIVAGVGHGALLGSIFGGITGAGIEGISTVAREGATKLTPKLEKLANSEMWRDINSGKGITKQAMARVDGGTEALGATAREAGLDDPRLNVQGQLAKATEAKESAGAAIGEMYRRSGATGRAGDLVDRLDGLIADAGKVAGNEGTVESLKSYRESLLSKLVGETPEATAGMDPKEAALFNEEARLRDAGQAERAEQLKMIREAKWGAKAPMSALDAQVPIVDMWQQRKGLNRLVYQESKALDPKLRVELLRTFSGHFGDFLTETGEKAAAAEGAEFAAPLRKLNKQYQHLSIIEDSLEEKVARDLTNRRHSLTDSIFSAGGAGGAMTALSAGHPLVAAGMASMGFANKFLREKGPQLGAYVLGRVGSLEGVAGHVRGIDAGIERVAAALGAHEAAPSALPYRVPARAEKVASAKDERRSNDEYEARAGLVRELADHPELNAGVGVQFAHLDETAPASAKAAAATTKAGLKYLASKLPPPIHLDPMRPEETTPPSLGEQQKWLRSEAAVSDPHVLFEQVKSMRLDPLTIDAVRTVYPNIYQKLVEAVHEKVMAQPEKFDRRARAALSSLIGVAMTPAASANGIVARQQTYAMPPQQGGMGRGSAGKTALGESAKTVATATDQIAKGD